MSQNKLQRCTTCGDEEKGRRDDEDDVCQVKSK